MSRIRFPESPLLRDLAYKLVEHYKIFYKLNAVDLDEGKLHALLVEALMHIKEGKGLNQPDVKTFLPLARVLGPDWKNKEFLPTGVLHGELLKGVPVQQRLSIPAHPAPAPEAKQPEPAPAEEAAPEPATNADPAEPPPADDDWQPDQPYVRPNNVVPLHPTGTAGGS